MGRALFRPLLSMVVVGSATGFALRSGHGLLIVPGVFLLSGVVATVLDRGGRWGSSYAANAAAGVFATVTVVAIGASRVDPATLDSDRWVIGGFWMFASALWASLGVGVIGPIGWVLRTKVFDRVTSRDWVRR